MYWMSSDDLARDSNECSNALWRQTSDLDLGIDVVEGNEILLVSCGFFLRPVLDEVFQGCQDYVIGKLTFTIFFLYVAL